MEMMACSNLAVPAEIMQHVVNVESSHNPFAIGVVGGRLVRQPINQGEAIATAKMLEAKGYNYSLGVAQVNRANLGKFGLDTFERAFDVCPNLVAGSQILAQCYARSGADWGKAFSCYYSGNFTTGFEHGYVQKVFDSMTRWNALTPNAVASPVATPPPAIAAVNRTDDNAVFVPQARRLADAIPTAVAAEGFPVPPAGDPADTRQDSSDTAFVF